MTRRMLRAHLVTIALAVCPAGCGTFATATWLNGPPQNMEPRRSNDVEIYASSPPSRPHVDVAMIEVEQTRGLNERGTHVMVSRLLKKAGAMGCDAVFVSGTSERDGIDPTSAWSLLDPGATTLRAVCMVYEPDETVMPFRARSPEHPVSSAAAAVAPVHQLFDNETPR